MTTYLLEIGTEELPPDFISNAIAQWKNLIPQTLKTHFLDSGKVQVYGTPRRLAVLITGLPEKQPDIEEEIKGPPVSLAYKDGKPTPALEGFAKKQGILLEDIEIKDTPKGEFIFVQKKNIGKLTSEILQELSPHWITSLEGRRFMRWGDGDLRFPRPIRWIVALWDGDILPLELVSGSTKIKSDRLSCGHRVLHPELVSIDHGQNYISTLDKAKIIVDPQQRENLITQQINALTEKINAVAIIPPELLTEVTNLVEYPTALLGKFDEEFLSLPPEVITTVMVKHQRYFPIKQKLEDNGKLLPYFITISNGDPAKSEIITQGNGRVIRARLADAQYFYKADCDDHLDSYLPQLENVTFQEQLGSIRDKVDRIMEIAQQICDQLDLSPQQRTLIESTAMLCKADLVTQMVYEFPELQGVMGEKYALVSGEAPTVAKGIFEHYLPRGSGDKMPQSITGQVVGISDRLDTLVSIFGLGLIPTGSADPFALRRATNGVINIIWHGELKINLLEILDSIAAEFVIAHSDRQSPLILVKDFFAQRLRTLLQEELKIDYDLVNAVLGEGNTKALDRALEDLLDLRDRAKFLQQIRQDGQLNQIYETVNRSARLALKGNLEEDKLEPNNIINPNFFQKSSEKDFYDGLVRLVSITKNAQKARDYQKLVDGLKTITPQVEEFFDGENSVLVMDENPHIQENRLNLLALLRNHALILGDFGAIVKG
jgi:glycyl-tRNA synthetase beta chain